MTPIAIIAGAVALIGIPFLAVGVVYRVWLQKYVRFHFGEEFSWRADRAAISRRRCFERHCFRAAACLFFAAILGIPREVAAATVPQLVYVILSAQVLVFLIAALSAWLARARWRNPFDNPN